MKKRTKQEQFKTVTVEENANFEKALLDVINGKQEPSEEKELVKLFVIPKDTNDKLIQALYFEIEIPAGLNDTKRELIRDWTVIQMLSIEEI